MPTVLLVLEFLGTTELMVIALVALIIFGPRKLPEIGRTVGRSLAEFKRASEDFKRTWEYEVDTERTQTALRGNEQEAVAAAYAPEAVIARESLPAADGAEGDGTDIEAVATDGSTVGQTIVGQTIARAPSDFAPAPATVSDDFAAAGDTEAAPTFDEGSATDSALAESTAGEEPPADDPADAADSRQLRGRDS